MADGGDLHPSQNHCSAAATESIDQEQNPAVPPPPPPHGEIPVANPPRLFPASSLRIDLTQESRSLINSLRSDDLNAQETATCLQSLYNLMTSGVEGEAEFIVVTSKLYESDLRSMASLLTSNSDDYFLEIARNRNGAIRLRKLLGRSDDADTIFLGSILRHFLDVMNVREAYYVVIDGMRVFSAEKKVAICDHICNNVIALSRDQYGSLALRKIIKYLPDFNRDEILFEVALNAPMLSCDDFGNFVVQRVLQMSDFRYRHNVTTALYGHCVRLSSTTKGRYVVQKLLQKADSRVVVVTELSWCDKYRLKTLAMDPYGSHLVEMALKFTQNDIQIMPQLFGGLVYKLRPFIRLLCESPHGRRIGEFLKSIKY